KRNVQFIRVRMRGQATLFVAQPFLVVTTGVTLLLDVVPTTVNITDQQLPGSTIATLNGHWSDNVSNSHPFQRGYLMPTNFNKVYAVDQNADFTGNLKINPAGPGVGGAGGTQEVIQIAAIDPIPPPAAGVTVTAASAFASYPNEPLGTFPALVPL